MSIDICLYCNAHTAQYRAGSLSGAQRAQAAAGALTFIGITRLQRHLAYLLVCSAYRILNFVILRYLRARTGAGVAAYRTHCGAAR